MSTSLYERIGGKEAVSATVLKLYEKVLADDNLSIFFDHVDVTRLKASQSAFVTMAFGGMPHYHGKSMRDAHRHLVKMGLCDMHFDLVATHLAESMRELGVPEEFITEAIAIVETTRNDVPCKGED